MQKFFWIPLGATLSLLYKTVAKEDFTDAHHTNARVKGAEECPAGWVNAQSKGCFAFLVEDTQLSWVEASIACEQAGGYLAEPKHIDQMEFLNALAGLQADFTGIKNWWIGLSDLNHEGRWTWQHSNEDVSEVFWGKNTPENKTGNSLDCARLTLLEDNRLVWTDLACGSPSKDENIAPLCQRDQESEGSETTTTMMPTTTQITFTTTSDIQVFECPEGWVENENSCYWDVFAAVNWTEANLGCFELHPAAHLAYVESESENNFIESLRDNELFYWLGGTDSEFEGHWYWNDGSAFEFTDWNSGEGGQSGTKEDCLALWSTDNIYRNTWYDYECSELINYICEINISNQ